MLALTDEQWQRERETAAQRSFGCSAEKFAEQFLEGAFNADEDEDLMYVLSFFPELD